MRIYALLSHFMIASHYAPFYTIFINSLHTYALFRLSLGLYDLHCFSFFPHICLFVCFLSLLLLFAVCFFSILFLLCLSPPRITTWTDTTHIIITPNNIRTPSSSQCAIIIIPSTFKSLQRHILTYIYQYSPCLTRSQMIFLFLM